MIRYKNNHFRARNDINSLLLSTINQILFYDDDDVDDKRNLVLSSMPFPNFSEFYNVE